MKKIRAIRKSTAIIFLLSSLLFILLTTLVCFGVGNKGKDGKNGNDANISISDNGEVILNEEKTGIFANKADCKVSINIEGEKYGRVIGGGKFAKGQTVALQAIPNADACFKGWKNKNGEIVSSRQNYTFIAQEKNVELTAIFEKSNIEIYFKTIKLNEQYFNNMVLQINDIKQNFVIEKDKYGREFYVLENPVVFNYGDTITFEFLNYKKQTHDCKCYLYEVDEGGYNGTNSNRKIFNITNEMIYTFLIEENREYYFYFDIEVNIIIERIPTIEISSNNDEYGNVNKTNCSGKGSIVTLTAWENESGTEDYIYKFKGWYLNNELVSTNYMYSFTADEYYYNFEARFVKKYALRFDISVINKDSIYENLDPASYYASFKKIKIHSIDSLGNINTISFNGNYEGQTYDSSTKICGYFELKEKIFLSNEIEESHDTYYEIGSDGEKTYKEKFVYTKWKLMQNDKSQTFATGNSALFIINEEMNTFKINIELFVVHYGDRVGD